VIAVLGRKGEMTQVFTDEGRAVPVTAVDVSGCVVVSCRAKGRDGYEALQLGLGKANPKRLSKPMAGFFAKAGVEPTWMLREIRIDSAADYAPGQALGADLFQPGDKVSAEGRTKGRGFAGGMKRWGWHGGPRTHGSMTHRRVGSISAGTTPGRILKGRTMPGHYGVEKVLIRNLRVIKVEAERNLVFVKGAIPGHRGGVVLLRKDQ
jgi:large subunit ribosomal protein L3